MSECKQGGEHRPVKIQGYRYCGKCNKYIPQKGKKEDKP